MIRLFLFDSCCGLINRGIVGVSPEAGQGQPAGQQPGGVAEPTVQVGVQLGHPLIQHAADLLPVKAAAGRQDDELGQSLKQV